MSVRLPPGKSGGRAATAGLHPAVPEIWLNAEKKIHHIKEIVQLLKLRGYMLVLLIMELELFVR